MPSKGLATSGTRWGLSCVVDNEASLGVVLGHMKLFGAVDIGFEPLGPAAKRRKDPARVATGKKGGRPKGIRNHSRKPLMDAARGFLDKLKMNAQFKFKDLAAHLAKEGWPEARGYSVLVNWKNDKVVKKVGTGLYKRAPGLKLVKPAA